MTNFATHPMITAAVAGHLVGTKPPSALAKAAITALCLKTIPNEPNTAAQGSLRLWPGVLVHAYAYQHGILPEAAADNWLRFAAEERDWRNLNDGGPAEDVARTAVQMGDDTWVCSGMPILNKQGAPVPVTVADAQHFEMLPHVFGATLLKSGTTDLLEQGGSLVAWAHHWSIDTLPKEDNARAIGWVLERMMQVYRTGLALGANNVDAFAVVNRIVDRLEQTAGVQQGLPYLVLNAAGLYQKDHHLCRVQFWMQGRIVNGLGMVLETPGLPPQFLARVLKLWKRGLASTRAIMEQAEKDGAPLGGTYDDADPGDEAKGIAPYFGVALSKTGGGQKWDGTMSAWAMPSWLAVERLWPAEWPWWRARAEARYQREGRYHVSKWAAHHHNASIGLLLAGAFGEIP